MQHSRQSTSRTRPSGAAAEQSSDARRSTAQRDAITDSPRVVAQRAMISEVFGRTAQREPLPEEELKQAKLDPVQREGEEETIEDEEENDDGVLQGKFATVQREESPSPAGSGENRTGLPDGLKSGIESLSGMSMDHVRVHYGSSQPAQLNALAYAQGSDIHVGPGQEQHLPHEAWHVVQQAQGRVRPTMQMKDGVPVNDEASLEQEADVMGAKALSGAVQLRRELAPASTSGAAVQRRIIPGTLIDVSNATNMPTWEQAGFTWHINTTTDTHHVTKEGVPKVQYFFTGAGLDIEDQRPTKKEQGGSSRKRKKVKGEKTIKVKTKCVFSELPAAVQDFVRNHYVQIFG